MAVDLRHIIGALRISNDLERIGDLAETAKRTLLVAKESQIRGVLIHVKHMVDQVRDQLVSCAGELSR